jgi:hypothetical protein
MWIVWIVFWWCEGSGSLITGTMCVRYIYIKKKFTVILGLEKPGCYTIDRTPIFYLPQTVPLSHLLLQQPRFKILQKQPRTERRQFKSKLLPLCPFFFPNEDKKPKPSPICPSIVTIAEKRYRFVLGKVTRARDP